MILGQELELSLGLPIVIGGFKDGSVHMCYPFKLEEITTLNMLLSNFNNYDLYDNFKDELKTETLITFLSKSFGMFDEDLRLIVEQIDSTNFSEIIKDIKAVSGVYDQEVSTTNSVGGAKPESTWRVMVSSIVTYTSLTYNDIKDMTMNQLNDITQSISKKIDWEYKLSTVSMVENAQEHIKESDHPLRAIYSGGHSKTTKRHMTMEDISGLEEMVG